MIDPPPVVRDPGQLVRRLLPALAGDRRFLLGIAGPPGSGKSTLAAWLEAELNARGGTDPPRVARLPMDGFHLPNAALARHGLADRKGAPDTFDVAGYVALLRRARTCTGAELDAPAYSRRLHEPVPGVHRIPVSVRVVLTEGNYLLLPDEPWRAAAACLDEVWFLATGPELTRQRLIARRIAGGREPTAATAWVDGNDMRHTALVAATARRADLIVDLPSIPVP